MHEMGIRRKGSDPKPWRPASMEMAERQKRQRRVTVTTHAVDTKVRKSFQDGYSMLHSFLFGFSFGDASIFGELDWYLYV